MSEKLQKYLKRYLSKIKTQTQNSRIHSKPLQVSRILSTCKHPKTQSFANENRNDNVNDFIDHQRSDDAATLVDIDRFLVENFRSLFVNDDDEDSQSRQDYEDEHKIEANGDGDVARGELSFRFPTPPLNLGDTFAASNSSGSLIEDNRMSIGTAASTNDNVSRSSASTSKTLSDFSTSNSNVQNESVPVPNDCIVVLRPSSTQHADFHQSMLEMVETRIRFRNGEIDWDFMEELLFCYLDLNEKKSHKFIMSAFADLIIELRKGSNKLSEARSRIRRSRMKRRKSKNIET